MFSTRQTVHMAHDDTKLLCESPSNRAREESALKAEILLPDFLTHRQIYVAFSDCRNPNNIFYVWADQTQLSDDDLRKRTTYLRNLVYQEVI